MFRDEAGSLAGFEVDLRDALARELGRPIEFKQYAFDTLFAGLERGERVGGVRADRVGGAVDRQGQSTGAVRGAGGLGLLPP